MGSDELKLLHNRLEAHFLSLRDERCSIGAPVFALEHGLSEPERVLLAEQVGSAVRRGPVPPAMWLPFVVYAAEVGYEYSGDEYWQTFEARTPGWVAHGDRYYIRRAFREFKEKFGGAKPSGPWAENFSIICWPITHAVLPADLQRHLARLLFEYRRALTSELLADPDELGRNLAARSWQTSSRFRHFAQNSALLGRVSASLLAGEDEQSPYLLDSTLKRIVDDLSDERLARQWLYGARTAAGRIRTRGFLPAARSSPSPAEGGGETSLSPVADPDLSLRKEVDGWIAFLDFPDLSVLAERFPEIVDELGRRRATVAGVAGAPVARGRLLYPGQRLRLSGWPPTAAPLLQVEGGKSTTNSVLADQCVLSPGPSWLFRVREPGYATEVRTKQVRSGQEYILLSEGALPQGLPPWITEAVVQVEGVLAHEIHVPEIFDDVHLDVLHGIGVTTLAELEIRPAGLVPASWDGEGRAEWIAGERPILAVSSTRTAGKSVWALDGCPHVVDWPSEASEMFVGLGAPGIGAHELLVSMFGPGDEPIAEGALEVRIRPPRTRPESGTHREGLMILATPVNPTLTELWDGEATVEIRGPAGVEAEVQIVLRDRSGSAVASAQARAWLPVETKDWAGLFERLLRQEETVHRVYDDVETCLISVSHDDLGTAVLRCERPFAPLRWAAGRDGDGPFLRLIDHTEGVDVDIRLFDFPSPDRPHMVSVNHASLLRSKPGGLAIARAGAATTAMILPPTVRHIEDLQFTPRLSSATRSLGGVLEMIDLAGEWGGASRPSDPFAERWRVKVLRLFAGHIAGLVGGRQWTALERRVAEKGDVDDSVLLAAIGSKSHQRALSRDVSRWTDGLSAATPEERVESLATSLSAHARSSRFRSEDHRFAEFLLRLASAPETLASWAPDELRAHVGRVLDAPFLIRAARNLVLVIEEGASDGVPATFEGWAWK